MQQMKEAEKSCLELAVGRLDICMAKKGLQLERKKHALNSQLAEVHTLEKDMKTRCEELDQANAEVKA